GLFVHSTVYGKPVVLAAAGAPAATAAHEGGEFHYFAFMSDPRFSSGERTALFVCLFVAFMALGYAGMLVGQVNSADQGTPRMQEIAAAVREGANAYLKKQLTTVAVLIL